MLQHRGAFVQLKVTDATGNVIAPKRSMPLPRAEDIFIEKDNESIQCIQGFELKNCCNASSRLSGFTEILSISEGVFIQSRSRWCFQFTKIF